MKKKLFAIVMSATMVMSFMPSLAFAAPIEEHSCTWATTQTEEAVKDGKIVSTVKNCDYDFYNVYKCTDPKCDKYDTARAVLVKKGPMHDWAKQSDAENCEEKWEVWKCEHCDAVEKRNVVALETKHNFKGVSELKSPATCTSNEVYGYKCANPKCNVWERTWEVEGTKLPHDFSALTVTEEKGVVKSCDIKDSAYVKKTAASCMNDETYVVTCKNCDATETYVVPNTKTPHNFSEKGKRVIPATCTTPGKTIYYCDTPGCTEVKKTIESSKPAHKWDEGKTVKKATCTEDGTKEYTCTVCKEKKTEVIKAAGKHAYAGKRTKVKDATCTEDEVWAYKCANCTEYVEPVVNPGTATGHTEAEKFVPSTCTEKAYASKYCTVCKVELSKRDLTEDDAKAMGGLAGYDATKVEPTGHEFVLKAVDDATCSKEGVKTYKCDCGETRTETIAKLPHTAVVETVDATCTEAGVKTTKCSVCNDVIDTVEIPALGHKEEVLPAVKATATKTGLTEGKKCSVCNDVLVPQTVTVAKAKTPSVKAGKKSLTATAAKVTGATKYQVAYKRSGSKYTWKYATASAKNAQTIKKLVKGKKYYVKVRTISGDVVGAWSSTKAVKVK